jgi:ATP-dependent Clp protease adaptor protein ClpS
MTNGERRGTAPMMHDKSAGRLPLWRNAYLVLKQRYPSGVSTVETSRPPVRKPRPSSPGPGGGQGDAARVIVLNDNHNTFEGVAAALAQYIPGVDLQKGMAFATRIHESGSAMVWSGERERAELYWEQLRDAGLTMAPLE